MKLLLAAFAPELTGLEGAPPPGWRVAECGVGAVVAAARTARLLAALAPERVLFVGTCGALDERLAVGELVSVAEAVATSLEELSGRAYRPGIETVRWTATWSLPLPAVVVAVPPAITCSEEGARALARVAAVEHLELSGVLAACAEAGVPAGAALAVANRVGPGANLEWRANHAGVSRSLVAELRRLGLLPAP